MRYGHISFTSKTTSIGDASSNISAGNAITNMPIILSLYWKKRFSPFIFTLPIECIYTFLRHATKGNAKGYHTWTWSLDRVAAGPWKPWNQTRWPWKPWKTNIFQWKTLKWVNDKSPIFVSENLPIHSVIISVVQQQDVLPENCYERWPALLLRV